jgi:hypothetical protein
VRARAKAFARDFDNQGSRLEQTLFNIELRQATLDDLAVIARATLEMTGPELTAIKDVVAEWCYVGAGAAYGALIDDINSAATTALSYATSEDPDEFQQALEYAGSASRDMLGWRYKDREESCPGA